MYLALAQVQQGSNLTAGIPRLQQAIERHNPTRAEFYYELARAYAKTSNYAAVMQWCEAGLRHDVNFTAALKELAAKLRAEAAMGRSKRLPPMELNEPDCSDGTGIDHGAAR